MGCSGRNVKMEPRWRDIIIAIMERGNPSLCPECGERSIQYIFVGDLETRVGYLAIWCTACNQGLHAVFDDSKEAFIPLTKFYHDQVNRISESSVIAYLNVLEPFIYWLKHKSRYKTRNVWWDDESEAVKEAVRQLQRSRRTPPLFLYHKRLRLPATEGLLRNTAQVLVLHS
jgi:hypothetical protein